MIHCVISFYNIPNWIKCVKTVAPKIPMGPRSGSITCISTRKYILKKFFTSIIYDITIQIRVHSNVLLSKCFNFNYDPLTNNWIWGGVANSALEYIDKHLEKKFVKIHNSTICDIIVFFNASAKFGHQISSFKTNPNQFKEAW